MHALVYMRPMFSLCPRDHLCPNTKKHIQEKEKKWWFFFLSLWAWEYIFLVVQAALVDFPRTFSLQWTPFLRFRVHWIQDRRHQRGNILEESLKVNSYFECQSSSSSLLSWFITQSLQTAVAYLLFRLHICIQWVIEVEFLAAEFFVSYLKYTLLP